jgi:hypothetical protein
MRIDVVVDGENLETIMKHYKALPILLRYIIKKNKEGDPEAYKVLADWDKARTTIISNEKQG